MKLSLLAGCDVVDTASDAAAPKRRPSREVIGASIDTVLHKSAPGPSAARRLTHNFGVVLPGRRLRHPFAVSNPSDDIWVLTKIVRTCNCSVVEATNESIAAGGSESFVFRYDPPNSPTDDARSVYLHFNGDDGPVVELAISAQIRLPMTCFPGEIGFGTVSTDRPRQLRKLSIHNYSQRDWRYVRVVDKPDWLTVSEPRRQGGSPTTVIGQAPRELWIAELRCDPAAVNEGSYHGRVIFGADSSESHADVTVSAIVTGPVRYIPSLLFLRQEQNNALRGTVRIYFTNPPDRVPHDVLISHDTQEDLQFHLAEESDTRWRLEAEMAAAGEARFVTGKITLDFQDNRLGQVLVPLSGRIVERKGGVE